MKRSKILLSVFTACFITISVLSFFGIIGTSYYRFSYFLFHAGWLHLMTNAFCMIAIIRSPFRIPAAFTAASIVIASCSPLGESMTVGASGVCYALLGMMSWDSIDKKVFHGFILFFIALGLIFPHRVNWLLHLFCYTNGVLFGYLCKR